MWPLVVLLGLATLVGLFIWWRLSDCSEDARGYAIEKDPWEPPQVVNNILTQDECQQIIQRAETSFSRSTVLSDAPVDDSVRTSETAWIDRSDPIVAKLVAKATELTDLPFENMEDIQVVRYKPGTYYRAHHDSCCDESGHCSRFAQQGGQRAATLLVYLNSDFTEGQTHFPEHGDLKLKADPGSAIFFRPLSSDSNRKCHPKALHAGLPIGQGTKYVCNVWVRENVFK